MLTDRTLCGNVPLETATYILEKAGFYQKVNGMKTTDTMPKLQVASGSYIVTEPPQSWRRPGWASILGGFSPNIGGRTQGKKDK